MASQIYGDVEHIMVDGGSSDGTIDVLNACRDQLDVLISEAVHGADNANGVKQEVFVGDAALLDCRVG